ncbi:hypothetical protein [Francisella orientalis]|uniref:hypothetical protein n=1 Tax=Francisella orientalis TaxID=299583 RepID=UPI00355925A0
MVVYFFSNGQRLVTSVLSAGVSKISIGILPLSTTNLMDYCIESIELEYSAFDHSPARITYLYFFDFIKLVIALFLSVTETYSTTFLKVGKKGVDFWVTT